MKDETIAILMPGDMGHAVGRALRENGKRVVTALDGRSTYSRELADRAGLEDLCTLNRVVGEADLVLSILPPSAALQLATDVAAAMKTTGKHPVYADCNAVSPQTACKIAETITAAGAPFIDGGIIGLAPGKSGGTRIYVSGENIEPMTALDGMGFSVIPVGTRPGKASAVKMTYAGLSKGTWTLQTAILLTASRLGVLEHLLGEFETSQSAALNAMRSRIPRLPADSQRWIGEMEEIAATFQDAGVPSGFHESAAEIFRIMAKTPFASETRETIDATRTLEQALAAFDEQLDNKHG